MERVATCETWRERAEWRHSARSCGGHAKSAEWRWRPSARRPRCRPSIFARWRRERLAELPGGVFRRGFVRSYLGALGLEEGAWMRRFEESCRESGVRDPAEDGVG